MRGLDEVSAACRSMRCQQRAARCGVSSVPLDAAFEPWRGDSAYELGLGVGLGVGWAWGVSSGSGPGFGLGFVRVGGLAGC
jgi:hypothetical protein